MLPAQNSSSNQIILSMRPDDFAALQPRMERVEVRQGQVMIHDGEPIEHVFFPEGGVWSVMSQFSDTVATEVGVFGREGMSSIGALLGAESSTSRTVSSSTDIRACGSNSIISGRL